MEMVFVYITTKDAHQARTIGRTLVDERLAACVNIIDGMQSIYRWEGNTCEEGETVLIAKTRQSLFDALTRRVKELHSYSCPCIVALPITEGNTDFLEWIRLETGD